MLDCAHAYARAHGLKVVEVSDHPLHILRNRTYASASIETFISLVCHAEMVFCNSLHGVCLSILFNREFYAFSRPGGGEKYRDLVRKFGLEDRYIEKNAFQEAEPIRWAEVNARREELRSESLTWLDEQIVAAAAALLESRKARV